MAHVVDPVCGMTIDSQQAHATVNYQGQTYYVCSPACKKAFEKDAMRYAQSHQDEHSAHKH